MVETKTRVYFKDPRSNEEAFRGDSATGWKCRVKETTYGKATWTTEGKGFGRRTGWKIPGIMFLRLNQPHLGAVKIVGKKFLDTKTGQIYSRREHCKIYRFGRK